MSTVRIYRSTDPGAPPHPSSVRGSMAALLRACLVTGWTSGDFTAEPAGWEEPFEEINGYACFRALQGTAQMFYQIDDFTTNDNVTLMTMFDSMGDAQSGTGSRGAVYFGKWYNATESQHWVVIADEKTCYVVLDGQDWNIIHGFGEYTSLIDNDPCPAFISGHNDSYALADDDTNIALHSTVSMHNNSWRSGYIRRSISAAEHSSFAILNMGVGSGDPVSSHGTTSPQFTTDIMDGVKWLHMPLIIRAQNDINAGIYLPCGLLRGVRQLLAKGRTSQGLTMAAQDRELFVIGFDAGGSKEGSVAFDLNPAGWD